jgi:hypothetical protein
MEIKTELPTKNIDVYSPLKTLKIFNDIENDTKNSAFFYSDRPVLPYRYSKTVYTNEQIFIMHGGRTFYDKIHNRVKAGVGLATRLNIVPRNITSTEFNPLDTELKYILDSGIDTDLFIVQTFEKQGNSYNIINYSFKEYLGTKKLVRDESAVVDISIYSNTYPKYGDAFAGTHLIAFIDLLPFSFKDISKITLNDFKTHPPFLINRIITIQALAEIVNTKIPGFFNDQFLKSLAFQKVGRIQDTFDLISLNEIEFKSDLEITGENKCNIYYERDSDGEIINTQNPMDILSYASIFLINRSPFKIELYQDFDIIDYKLSDTDFYEIREANETRLIHKLSAEMQIITDTNVSEIPSKFSETRNQKIADLNLKWQKIITRFDALYKPKSMDKFYLALTFIKKYFFPTMGSNHAPSNEYPGYDIISLFEISYGSFQEFFGMDNGLRHLKYIQKGTGQTYTYTSGKLSKCKIPFSSFPNSKFDMINLVPVSYLSSSYSQRKYKSVYIRKNRVIINNSGTKTSWLNKTRVYLDRETRKNRSKNDHAIKYWVINPDNKISLMFLEQLAKVDSMYILYTDFEKEISIQKKEKPVDKKLSLYKDSDIRLSGNIPFKRSIENFDPKNEIYVEYIVTKSLMKIDTTEYKFNKEHIYKLCDIIKKYYHKRLIFLPSSSFKAVQKKYPDDFVSIANFIEHDHSKIKPLIQQEFLIFSKKSYNEARSSINFIIGEFIMPNLIMSRRLDRRYFIKKIDGLILSLPKDVENLIRKLELVFNSIPNVRNTRHINRYSLEQSIVDKYIVVDTSVNGFTDVVYSKIFDTSDINEFQKTFSSLFKFRSEPRGLHATKYGSVFSINDYLEETDRLLETSKYLNLSKEDFNRNMDIIFMKYLYQWNLSIKLIEKDQL